MSDPRLLAARWLLDAGAGASAARLLSDVRGREANDIREASERASLRPGVCALVVHEDQGLVFPLRARVGSPASTSVEMRAACGEALGAARSWFDVTSLPALRLELEELLSVTGTSLTLPAALAFVVHFAPVAMPRRAVLATGRLDPEGRVLPVLHVPLKVAAAASERGERIVLVPRGQRTSDDVVEVDTLADAIAVALGPARHPDPSLVALEALVERARAESSPALAVELLEAIDLDRLPPADRARVHLELGTALRHAGRTDRAAEHHASARRLLGTERLVVGAETVERYELEVWLTAMDRFHLEDAAAAVGARMREPFLSARNELRCRGMLAQIHAMRGDLAEAVRTREENLPLHALSDELARVLPGTLCYLALDSARAGDAAGFERYSRELLAVTRPGDTGQWRYTAYAIVRGLVALGKYEEALAWGRGASEIAGVCAPPEVVPLVSGEGVVSTHPETTIVRALVRAHWRAGNADAAIAMGRRVEPRPAGGGSDLAAWVARLVELEVALAEVAGGGDPAARVARARAELAVLHVDAAGHYARVLTCEMEGLAAEIDRVYY